MNEKQILNTIVFYWEIVKFIFCEQTIFYFSYKQNPLKIRNR